MRSYTYLPTVRWNLHHDLTELLEGQWNLHGGRVDEGEEKNVGALLRRICELFIKNVGAILRQNFQTKPDFWTFALSGSSSVIFKFYRRQRHPRYICDCELLILNMWAKLIKFYIVLSKKLLFSKTGFGYRNFFQSYLLVWVQFGLPVSIRMITKLLRDSVTRKVWCLITRGVALYIGLNNWPQSDLVFFRFPVEEWWFLSVVLTLITFIILIS